MAPVDADPLPRRRGHPVGQGLDVVVVESIASSSPLARLGHLARNFSACSSGSFSSEKPFATSIRPMKSSNRSAVAGSRGLVFERGENLRG